MKTNSATRRQKKSPAFSLVLSLAIMSMILIMVLSLAAFLAIELRQSSSFTAQMIARQNALMGARVALGKLQALAGPDRRISAPGIFAIENAEARRAADETTLPNAQWVGIWSTIDKTSPIASATIRPFYIGYHENGKLGDNAYLSDTRNRAGTYRRPEAMEWLVTQVPHQVYTPQTAPEQGWVTMLNYKNRDGFESTVKVPYLGFNEEGIVTSNQIGATGRFAYWASDEGMKARINLFDPRKEIEDISGNPMEGYYKLLGPAANNITLVQNPVDKSRPYAMFNTVAINNRLREIVTLQTTALLDFGKTASDRADSIRQNFLDFTDVSSGVLASTNRGGLLSDMTAYLHAPNSTIASDGSVTPAKPGIQKSYASLLITSEKHENSGPTFEALRKWYDTPLPSSHGNAIDIAKIHPVQAPDGGHNVPDDQALRIVGITGGWDVGEYQWPKLSKFLDQTKNTQYRGDRTKDILPYAPILVEARFGYDFAINAPGIDNSTPTPEEQAKNRYNMKTFIFPQVALWNPYSIPIKTSKASGSFYAVHVYWLTVLRLNLGVGDPGPIWPKTTKWTRVGHMFDIPIANDVAKWRGAIADPADGGQPDQGSPGNGRGNGFGSGNYGDYFNFQLDPHFEIPPGETLVYRPKWYYDAQGQGYAATRYWRYLEHAQMNSTNFRDQNLLSPSVADLSGGDGGIGGQHRRVSCWVFQPVDNRLYIPENNAGGWLGRPYRVLDYTYGPDSNGAASTFTYPGVTLKYYDTGYPSHGDFRKNPMFMPTLQRLNMTLGGEAPYVQSSSGVLGAGHAMYDTSYWLLGSDTQDSEGFTKHDVMERQRSGKGGNGVGTPPPSGFQVAFRLIRFDETDENEITIGGQSRFGPDGAAINISPITNFNIRSPIPMRIPNAYYDKTPNGAGPGSYYGNGGWARNLATGPYIIEWAKPRLWAGEHEPFEYNGLLHGAPFTKWGSSGSLAKAQTKVILFDFPARGTIETAAGPSEALALTSLADFRFAWLSPFVWHPTYVVGSGLMDPFSSPNATINTALYEKRGIDLWPMNDVDFKGRGGHSKLLNGMNETDILLYDIAFEVNFNLFDNYFLSTLLKGTETGKTVWNGTEALPNARLKLHKSVKPGSVEFAQATATANEMFHRVAGILINDGAFNVNSTSVEAWVAFLSSTIDLQRPTKNGTSSGAGVHFSKFLTPELNGEMKTPKLSDKKMYQSYRVLSHTEIRKFAEKIVEEVKFRGPFLSLSDFVNRRLIGSSATKTFSGDEIMALRSTLEQAILDSNLNDTSDMYAVGDAEILKNGIDDLYVAAFPKRKSQNLAGHISQMEILSTLGQSMTARSDTFKIRVYGDTRPPTSTEPIAKAYLEMVVQRQPQFYDTSDPAHTQITVTDDDKGRGTPRENDQLKPANRQFGRRFEIVSLRWLSLSDI